jgi:ATP adenylyltransferase
MKTMWAPWRIEYILGEKESGCVFCNAAHNRDGLTLHAGDKTMVVMNKYPYANGHLLVAPIRHLSSLSQLTSTEREDIMTVLDKSVGILKKTLSPDGFNVGLNLGKAAGAGVAEHLHFHVVPRWFGDVNAMTVLADVRIVPEHLQATCQTLKPYFNNISDAV